MALEEQVVKKLIEKNFHISFAESCTGGMCCGTIVNVANASKVLDVSFVTYANEAKIEFLGVKADTILSNGVVSEEVAYEMAQGVANVAKSEVGVGVTGVAGPGGGTDEKPVGTVFIGICVRGNADVLEMHYGGSRDDVREKTCETALEYIYEKIAN